MGGCCVYQCKSISSGKKKTKGVSFHRFPKERKQIKRWVWLIRTSTLKVNSATRICSLHFTNADFIYNVERGSKRLRPKAVPSIFPTLKTRQPKERRKVERKFPEESFASENIDPFESPIDENIDPSESPIDENIDPSKSPVEPPHQNESVCKFILAHPLSSQHLNCKIEALSFFTVCPICRSSYSFIVDKTACKEHIVSLSFQEAKASEHVLLDFPEVLSDIPETSNTEQGILKNLGSVSASFSNSLSNATNFSDTMKGVDSLNESSGVVSRPSSPDPATSTANSETNENLETVSANFSNCVSNATNFSDTMKGVDSLNESSGVVSRPSSPDPATSTANSETNENLETVSANFSNCVSNATNFSDTMKGVDSLNESSGVVSRPSSPDPATSTANSETNENPEAVTSSPEDNLKASTGSNDDKVKERLKMRIRHKNMQIKALRMQTYRAKKKAANLKAIIKALKKVLDIDNLEELGSYGELDTQLMELKIKALNRGKRPYGPELKEFALTLNYYSPRGYRYVRQWFKKGLGHRLPGPRTLSDWYGQVDGSPGFTKESFDTLQKKNTDRLDKGKRALSGHIILDEMTVMKKIEFDGVKYYGYIHNGFDDGSNEEAKQALVYMFVSADEAWKVPLGYFFINSINGVMKEKLMKECLKLLHESGTITLSVTFDGASENATMIKNLGCDLKDPANFESMKTFFICPYSNRKIFIFYDICHMFKLIRNFLSDLKVIFDENCDSIEWKYFVDLLELQEVEGFHLANKVRTQHISYHNYKMKVKLATQLLSDSVAKAFEVLRKLALKDFPNAGATIKFIQTFDKLFDIFNSKPGVSINFKTSLKPQNIAEMREFLKEAYKYITNLTYEKKEDKDKSKNKKDEYEDETEDENEDESEDEEENEDGIEILSSVFKGKRKTAFLGFLISIKSLLDMYEYAVENQETAVLSEIHTHRFCQDHLEMFFGIIRQHGGHRRNPTCRQFQSAYKKCLVHHQLFVEKTGNCIPREAISILNCASGKKPPNISVDDEWDTEDEFEEDMNCGINIENNVDHSYNFEPQELTVFSKTAITYITGCCIKKSNEVLKCGVCKEAMMNKPVKDHLLLIQERNRGGLIHPGEDSRSIIYVCEKLLRQIQSNSGGRFIKPKFSTAKLVKIALKLFKKEDLTEMFSVLHVGQSDSQAVHDHKMNLVSTLCHAYFNLKLHHLSRKSTEPAQKKRNFFNKLCDFRGT